MRISLNWLKDYLDIKPDVDVAHISSSLTLAGLEVEAIDDLKTLSAAFSLAPIVSVHDEKDGGASYTLDKDNKHIRARGPKGLLAKMVVAFRENMTVASSDKVHANIATYGDLGFLVQSSDAIAFDEEFFAGGIPDHLGLVKDFDDVIFTLGITPNRADALSHLGVSRELSAILDTSARVPMLTPKEMAGPTHEKIGIEIDNAEDSPRYACRIAENVTVQESPFWLKLRLLAVGIRPINNVVDITNYVMMSRGQPMHAFDYDALSKDGTRPKIVMRRAAANETLVALDGQKIELTTDDVVIADSNKALALAGVIGGLDSGVKQTTTTIVLESAYFDSKNVRMTARRHNITTESSYRFERGVDPNGVLDALNYAARLLTEISSAKICREAIDAYRKRIDPIEIKMRPERAQAILGIDADDFDQDILRRKFSRLGIETVAKRGDAIYFRVPTHRSDLTREIDLVEEAARMIGYDKVKEFPIGNSRDNALFCDVRLNTVTEKLRESFASRGFCEAINYAFLNREWQAHFIDDASAIIDVRNPLSDRYGVLRRSLVPSLVRNLVHNLRNQEKSIQLFEMGTVFLGAKENGGAPAPSRLFGKLNQDSFADERTMLAGVMSGRTAYHAFDVAECAVDFYHAKGIVSEIFAMLGWQIHYPHPSIVFDHSAPISFMHPGESATVYFQSGGQRKALGFIGRLHPTIAAKLDIASDVFVFEFDVEEIAAHTPTITKFKPFSRFPTIERDVAFLVNEAVSAFELLEAASHVEHAQDCLSSIRIFDIYRGKNIEQGKKSVAITMSLKRDDRTLTDEEAEAFVNRYVKIVETKTGAKMR